MREHRHTRVVLTLDDAVSDEQDREDSESAMGRRLLLRFYDQRNFGTLRVSFERRELEAARFVLNLDSGL